MLGVSCAEYRQPGAFAEVVAVPRHIVYRLPEGLSFEQAAMVEAVSGADVACEVVGIARASIRVDPLISAATPLAEGSQWLDRLYEREPGLMKVILKP